jgi:hypothetical protein
MRIKLLGLIDVLLVSKGEEIRWLNAHPDIVRPPNAHAGVLQWIVNWKTLEALRFDGSVLPVFLARDDVERSRRQTELANALDEPERVAPSNSQWLGAFVAKAEPAAAATPEELGVQVQGWCGRLFELRYQATRASYEAGRTIAQWPAAPLWRAWGRARKQLEEAKGVLLAAAGHDIHAVHATSIGTENIARSVRNMRALAERAGVESCSPERAVQQCLVVPPVLVRGCSREIRAPFLRSPLGRRSLVVFLLGHAYRKEQDLDLAFLDHTWSACPARHVVPSMLEGVWKAAVEANAKEHTAWQQLGKATARPARNSPSTVA